MKNGKNLIRYTLIILFVIFYMILFFPRKINSEYHAVIYRLGDSNYSENIKVSINGYFSKGLLKGDKFEGMITIGEKQLSKINTRFNKGRGLLSYYDENTGEYTSYGDMFSINMMREFTISVFEEDIHRKGGKSWSSKEGIMISAPADSRGKSIEISNKLMKSFLTNEVLNKYVNAMI